jgi:hypothetical protein
MHASVVICRNVTEAILLMQNDRWHGLILEVRERDFGTTARTTSVTAFGPATRSHDNADFDFLIGIIRDTIDLNEGNVFLIMRDREKRLLLEEELRAWGVNPLFTNGPITEEDGDPYVMMQNARLRPPVRHDKDGNPIVSSYATVYCEKVGHLELGDELRMDFRSYDNDTTEVFYVHDGKEVGCHGLLPRLLSDEEAERLDQVVTSVRLFSYGKERQYDGSAKLVQMIVFDIPEDVDEFLAGAKLLQPA